MNLRLSRAIFTEEVSKRIFDQFNAYKEMDFIEVQVLLRDHYAVVRRPIEENTIFANDEVFKPHEIILKPTTWGMGYPEIRLLEDIGGLIWYDMEYYDRAKDERIKQLEAELINAKSEIEELTGVIAKKENFAAKAHEQIKIALENVHQSIKI